MGIHILWNCIKLHTQWSRKILLLFSLFTLLAHGTPKLNSDVWLSRCSILQPFSRCSQMKTPSCSRNTQQASSHRCFVNAGVQNTPAPDCSCLHPFTPLYANCLIRTIKLNTKTLPCILSFYEKQPGQMFFCAHCSTQHLLSTTTQNNIRNSNLLRKQLFPLYSQGIVCVCFNMLALQSHLCILFKIKSKVSLLSNS